MIITLNKISTPIGEMIVGATDDGLCLLEFEDKDRLKKHFQHFDRYLKEYDTKKGDHPIINETREQLNDYFNLKRKSFDIPLHLIGTPFQLSVWKKLQTIPFGRARSYKEQAIALGNLKAIRAVAKTNGDNKIAIVIPCHRIVGSNNTLVGYGGGLWRKEFLLNLENAQLNLFK